MFQKPSSAPGELRRSSSSSNGGRSTCRQLERVAGWVSAGLYAAFFASLDRCACVKLETMDQHSNLQEPIIILRRRSKSEQPLLDDNDDVVAGPPLLQKAAAASSGSAAAACAGAGSSPAACC